MGGSESSSFTPSAVGNDSKISVVTVENNVQVTVVAPISVIGGGELPDVQPENIKKTVNIIKKAVNSVEQASTSIPEAGPQP